MFEVRFIMVFFFIIVTLLSNFYSVDNNFLKLTKQITMIMHVTKLGMAEPHI